MSIDTFYPIGTQVVLQGLQAVPEHNGKTGVVESIAGERQRIRLVDEDKVLGIRPKNLQLAPRNVETLSVKELKSVLQGCNFTGTTTGMDKRDLQEAVADLCTPERTAEVLVELARKEQPTTATSASAATAATAPTFNKEQIHTAADRMSSMDPAQLRQQAAMMKAMPPDQLRRTNPMFANMSDAQIQQMIAQFEMMASNPAMMQQAANQVKNMSPEDLERQRQAVLASNNSNGAATTGASSTTSASSSSATTPTATSPPANSAQMLSQMNPEQLKQQAQMLKSMPPHQIRSMHPQFSNMSDAQIQQMAAQMEMMADNPAMLKMAAETMGSMTPEQIQEIQQGRIPSNMGDVPDGGTAATMDQAASLLSNMSGKQVKDMLKMAKENPDMLKTAMPAGTDTTQVEKVINSLEGMDEATLDKIIAFLGGLQKFLSPFIKAYQSTNRAVGGHLFKLILFLFVALIWYWWFGGKSASTVGAPVALEEMAAVPEVETTAAGEFDDEF